MTDSILSVSESTVLLWLENDLFIFLKSLTDAYAYRRPESLSWYPQTCFVSVNNNLSKSTLGNVRCKVSSFVQIYFSCYLYHVCGCYVSREFTCLYTTCIDETLRKELPTLNLWLEERLEQKHAFRCHRDRQRLSEIVLRSWPWKMWHIFIRLHSRSFREFSTVHCIRGRGSKDKWNKNS